MFPEGPIDNRDGTFQDNKGWSHNNKEAAWDATKENERRDRESAERAALKRQDQIEREIAKDKIYGETGRSRFDDLMLGITGFPAFFMCIVAYASHMTRFYWFGGVWFIALLALSLKIETLPKSTKDSLYRVAKIIGIALLCFVAYLIVKYG